MSFVAPLWLLALLAIPLLLAAQWVSRQRARRYALRFPAVASLLEAERSLPRVRWRSILPLAALMLAFAAMGVALARPQVRHRVPQGNASVMLVLDHSGSMAATDVSPSRIAAAIAAGNTFIDQLPSNVKVGLVGFGSSPDSVQNPVSDHDATRQLLDSQQANGSTDTGPALELALQLLKGADKNHPPSAIVLLSDGAANAGLDPVQVARTARQDKIPIETVALGTDHGTLNIGPFGQQYPVPPDPALMREIASASGGRSFTAKSAGELSSIYKSLGSKLGSVEQEKDVTQWPAVAAGVLLLLALLGSGRYFALPLAPVRS